MALNSVGKKYIWSSEYVDLRLNNFTTEQAASTDYQSCTNTVIITAAGNKSKYPATWAAHEYKTERTEPGDWCLPAGGIMMSIKNNMSTINNGFNLIGGAQIETTSYWSSSEHNSSEAWYSSFSRDYGLYTGGYHKNAGLEVRPVLEF